MYGFDMLTVNETCSPFAQIKAGMFMNMAGQPGGGVNINVGGSDAPGAGIGANISLNFGEQTPEELTRTLGSVMRMFSGGVPGEPQNNGDDGRSAPR